MMTLYIEPIVAPSGETYSKATVARFENGCDPATREKIEDATKLPPNRAISRQVNTFIQRRLGLFTDRLRDHAAGDEAAKDTSALQDLIKSLSTILKVIQVHPHRPSLLNGAPYAKWTGGNTSRARACKHRAGPTTPASTSSEL